MTSGRVGVESSSLQVFQMLKALLCIKAYGLSKLNIFKLVNVCRRLMLTCKLNCFVLRKEGRVFSSLSLLKLRLMGHR